jgi:hypothetical protein
MATGGPSGSSLEQAAVQAARDELPFGLAGRIAHAIVARQLPRIYDCPTEVIDRLFGVTTTCNNPHER